MERKENRRRHGERGKTEIERERRPVWVYDKLSLFEEKIRLMPSGHHCFLCVSHVCMPDSARVRECVTDHITPSEDLGLTSGGQDLTPLLSPPTLHQLTHIFSHSY